MKQLALNYFLAWNAQDAVWLSYLLSENISLTDWDNSASGTADVIGLNQKIWKDFPEINVEVLDITTSETHCAAKLKIHLNPKGETLDVVDIFTFSRNGKIDSIKAYKG